MNKKLVRGSLAGVAVIALAAGSSTFSAWSDFDTIADNAAGADQLTLDLNKTGSQSINKFTLAPGVTNAKQFVVSSRTGDTVPTAALSVSMADLVGTEDGCTSTNSELAVDSDCANTSTAGEFIEEAEIRFYASVPKTDAATACSSNTGSPVGGWYKLDEVPASVALGDLAKGESRCILAEVRLPVGATNASQGDSAAFDLRFDLKQNV